MWCKKILVAYDGSAPSSKACDLARDIASHDPDIELVVLHIMRLFISGAAAAGMDTVVLDESEPIRRELQEIADSIDNPTTIKLLKGTSPADLIVKCAMDENCDLIIMGSRGQSGMRGYLGSVSYAVTKDSPVAVLIAKDD